MERDGDWDGARAVPGRLLGPWTIRVDGGRDSVEVGHMDRQLQPLPTGTAWEHWSRRGLRNAALPAGPAEDNSGGADGTAAWIVPIFIVLSVGALPALHAFCECGTALPRCDGAAAAQRPSLLFVAQTLLYGT